MSSINFAIRDAEGGRIGSRSLKRIEVQLLRNAIDLNVCIGDPYPKTDEGELRRMWTAGVFVEETVRVRAIDEDVKMENYVVHLIKDDPYKFYVEEYEEKIPKNIDFFISSLHSAVKERFIAQYQHIYRLNHIIYGMLNCDSAVLAMLKTLFVPQKEWKELEKEINAMIRLSKDDIPINIHLQRQIDDLILNSGQSYRDSVEKSREDTWGRLKELEARIRRIERQSERRK